MRAVVFAVMALSGVVPTKGWFAPDQPLTVTVKAEGEQALLVTDFNGRARGAKAATVFTGAKTMDLKDLYVQLSTPGTSVLYLTASEGGVADFVGARL